jgi:NitT/TauT family transport system ATP-binding protein
LNVNLAAGTTRTPHPAGAAEVEVRDLVKVYRSGRSAKTIVDQCSFTIERGKTTVMIGPSGVGKSTIVRLIAGFDRPTSGTILVDGRPVTGPGRDRLVVFQEAALFPWMTTAENILYGPAARGERGASQAADFLLDKVGLRAFRKKYPTQLSGGMQRRAELARAVINDPAVMILDEPFRGLDAMTKKLMLEFYARMSEEAPRTHFFVTTDIDEAIYLADRLLVMRHSPTSVRAVVEVDIPRPRSPSAILADDRANAIKMQTLSLLHEEAMKSFASGSKAAADFVDAYRRRSSSA